MNTSIVPQLISKDLFLMRPMLVGALAIGAIGIALLPFGELPFFIGWIVLLIATLLHGIFTTAVGVVNERKDRVHLFVLALPISPAQYLRAKLAASAIAFFVPWAILLAAALTLIAATGIPDGIIPFLAMLFGYVVCYWAAYLGMALVTDSVILSTLVIMFTARKRPLLVRWTSVAGTGISLLASIWVYWEYDRAAAGFQFHEELPLVPSLGISYLLAIDGISALMALLTSIIIFAGTFASWTVKERSQEFYALLLILVTGVYGVFVSLDLFILFLFYEIAVLPMYLLIGIWGSSGHVRPQGIFGDRS